MVAVDFEVRLNDKVFATTGNRFTARRFLKFIRGSEEQNEALGEVVEVCHFVSGDFEAADFELPANVVKLVNNAWPSWVRSAIEEKGFVIA
jgi:hypothetical protein